MNNQPPDVCPKCGVKSYIADPDGEVHVDGCNCSLHLARQQTTQLQADLAAANEKLAAIEVASDTFRHNILHGSTNLEANEVLGMYDDSIYPAIHPTPEQTK